MGRAKKELPEWSYEDNPFSRFARVTDDLIKSKKFRALGKSVQMFYIACMTHAKTEKAQECLYNALKERHELLGNPLSEFDLNRMVHDEQGLMFVFPKKHYEEYGYSPAYAAKNFKSLVDNGFLEVVQHGKQNKKVNIYKFSKKWKAPKK